MLILRKNIANIATVSESFDTLSMLLYSLIRKCGIGIYNMKFLQNFCNCLKIKRIKMEVGFEEKLTLFYIVIIN